MTVLGPLFLVREDAAALLKQLKQACGGGGTLKLDQTPSGAACIRLELQGDHVDRVLVFLDAQGFEAKRSGG